MKWWAVAMGVLAAGPAAEAAEVPLLVGGHAHGAANIRALVELGLGNFVWIPKQGYALGNVPWDREHDILADVDACVAQGLHFMVSQRRGLGRSFKPGGAEYGGDTTPEIHPKAAVRDIARRAGRLFVGLHAEELDADLVQNGLRASYRSRIPELYDFTDRAGGRRCFERELGRLRRTYHGYAPGVRFLPNLCIAHQHCGFRVGADIVMGELLESLPTTELQLAYLRGGGRQFGRDWGVWVSPWHGGKVPCEDKTLWPHPVVEVGGGHRASAFRRCLYLAFGSGARVLTVQEIEPLFSRAEGGGYKPAAWGAELKRFWEYARQHDARPDPIVPLALLVDKDNGWAPGQLNGGWIDRESVWAKLPADRSDAMLSAYLDVLLPGYGRKTPGWWQDKESFYPGYFAQTPIGAFDVVASDVRPEKLAHYPAVMLMADVRMTAELLETLRQYVRGGGQLHVNVNQMREREAFVQDPEFLGATVGMSRTWSDWSHSNLLMRRVAPSSRIVCKLPLPGVPAGGIAEPWYMAQDVQPNGAEVVADDGAGNPVLLRHAYGRGQVFLSTPDFLLDGTFAAPLNTFSALLRGLTLAGPVHVSAPGTGAAQADISWVASYQAPDPVMVVLANHGAVARPVEVHWRRPCSAGVIEVGAGRAELARCGSDAVFTFPVPLEDVVVLRILGVKRGA